MELREIKFLRRLYYRYLQLIQNASYKLGKHNIVVNKGIRINTRIQIRGDYNKVFIEDKAICRNSIIRITGDHCIVHINNNSYLDGIQIFVENRKCEVSIGKNTFVGGKSHLACTENGSRLTIGDDCMLSSYVQVRTGDSHSILDMEGNRINPAQSVHIGNHCWIGEGAKVLKGVTLNHDVVVSTGAIVTKSFDSNVLLGGIPAKIIKENITWDSKRL